MLLKSFNAVIITAGMALATAAWAQTNVTTTASELKVGGEIRGEYTYSDNGLSETKDNDPDASESLSATEVNVLMSGKIGSMTHFFIKFGLLGNNTHGPAGEALEEGYIAHWFTDMVGFSVGKQLVHQGGWDTQLEDFSTHFYGKYANTLPLGAEGAGYAPALAFHVKVAGEITLQLVEDVVKDPSDTADTRWNEREKLTWILAWHGTFGPIMPLVHIGSYDNDKSKFYEIGVRTQMAGVDAYLDFLMDTKSNKFPDPDDAKKTKSLDDTKTTFNIKVAYSVPKVVTPILYYSMFEVKEGTDDKIPARADEREYNSAVGTWDDNGTTLGLAVNVNSFGENITPYLAYEMVSGDFEDDEKAGEAEARSVSIIKLGAFASF